MGGQKSIFQVKQTTDRFSLCGWVSGSGCCILLSILSFVRQRFEVMPEPSHRGGPTWETYTGGYLGDGIFLMCTLTLLPELGRVTGKSTVARYAGPLWSKVTQSRGYHFQAPSFSGAATATTKPTLAIAKSTVGSTEMYPWSSQICRK
ncbi:hypothetical protein QBC37DRAFT_402262 [Rhypophila decipiens]|uniref:Uncharacterized protein n=1 Tax=Rhypophila decipiens TaxID=261697 RepID=A0AAN7B864_9PEZI|nr:hypothetical protein QBC37DRAFT_402262 [Rhypophila decipiens]